MSDSENTNGSNGCLNGDPVSLRETALNDSGTGKKIGTRLTQRRSADVLHHRESGKTSYTYFIQDGDAIKIGTSWDPNARLADLQVGNPRQLLVLAAVPTRILCETETHRMFSHLRLNGEWFSVAPDLLKFIDGLPKIDIRPRRFVPERTIRLSPPPQPKPQPEPLAPANFTIRDMRADLIAKRCGTKNVVLREQLGILIEQCNTYDRDPEARPTILAAMKRQVGVIDGTTRTMPFAVML